MILKSTSDIVDTYRMCNEPTEVFFSYETDEYLGQDLSEYDKVTFVNELRDYRKIWEICPNAVRLGSGEKTPYDESIIGYIKYNNGNGRIVYSCSKMAESLSFAYDIDIADAFEDIEYNTKGSIPSIEIENRPIIVDEVF